MLKVIFAILIMVIIFLIALLNPFIATALAAIITIIALINKKSKLK